MGSKTEENARTVLLGLGPNCQTTFQLRRWLASRQPHPSFSGFGSVFDWQGTPEPVLLDYFRRDLSGLFEFEDLDVGQNGIVNRRYGTSYMHRFPEGIDASGIRAHYAQARDKHEIACARMRTLFDSAVPLLLVSGSSLHPGSAEEIIRNLEQRREGRSVQMLCVDTKGIEPSPGREVWQGNDGLWDAALEMVLNSGERLVRYPAPRH